MENRKSSKSNQSNSTSSKPSDVSQSGKQNQFAGNVMVDFSVPGRTAFEGNNWYVRNPGYTCGRGSGTVYISILVICQFIFILVFQIKYVFIFVFGFKSMTIRGYYVMTIFLF